MVLSSLAQPRLSSSSTLMPIGLAVMTLIAPYSAMQFFLAAASSPRLPSTNPLSLDPAPRLSIGLSPMEPLKPLGCSNCCRSYINPSTLPASSTTTMSTPFTSPPTPPSITAPSTWTSTFTSPGNASPLVLFVCFMSLPRRRSLTSSPRTPVFCLYAFSFQSERPLYRRSYCRGGGCLELITLLALSLISHYLCPFGCLSYPIYMCNLSCNPHRVI